MEASDGAVWIAYAGHEAVRLDYRTDRWTTYENLHFQCDTSDGAQWFVTPHDIVCNTGTAWIRYGVEDGVMDLPLALMTTRAGELWAVGSHDSTAATARFDGQRWSLQTHPNLSWTIHPRAVYEATTEKNG